MDTYQWWWQGMGLMWLFPLVFLAIMAVFAFRGMGCMGFGRGHRHARETSRDILDRRFAAGEITKDQYEEMRRALAA